MAVIVLFRCHSEADILVILEMGLFENRSAPFLKNSVSSNSVCFPLCLRYRQQYDGSTGKSRVKCFLITCLVMLD